MDRLIQDLRIGVRSLSRQATFSLVAILTLALGIGATTAIFSVVYGVLLKPLPYVNGERIVAFGQTSRTTPTEPVDGSSSALNFADWKQRSKTIPLMALYTSGQAVISHQGEADVVRMGSVSPGFFAVFRAAPIVGREFTVEESLPSGPRAAIISHAFWQERFGGRGDVLGQTVEVSGVPWPVVGVTPPGFGFPEGARLWLPVRNNDAQCGRGCVFLNGIGRLADGVSVDAAQQEMAAIATALEREFPGDNYDVTVMVQSLHDRSVGNVRLALVVLLAAVGMVLLIACANVANLLLVRGAGRQNELAVRTALGAGRKGLMSYLLAETVVLALSGGLAGVLLAWWGIQSLRALAPVNLPRLDEVAFDVPTLGFSFLLVSATSLVFGLGPALQLSRVPLARVLGQRGAAGSGRSRWTRSTLLVAEVALSLVLLLGAGLLLRSLAALQATDMGFSADGITVFTVSLPAARYPDDQVIPTHDRLDAELGAMAGVTHVARISGLPLGPSENVRSFVRTDQPPPPPGQAPGALYRVVDAEYFQTMSIRLAGGRYFEATDRNGAQPVLIISRLMAEQFWPGEDPVGRSIRFSNKDTRTIVGVVENVRSQTLATQAAPEMYVPHAQTALRTVMYVVKGELPSAQVLSASRETVKRLDPRLPLIFPNSMRALVDEQLARPRFYLVLISLFAVLALVLAAVGLYGVVAFVVTQRTREIGVRMALGASQRRVVGLMLWHGLRPAALGMCVGLLLALALGRVVEGLLYQVRPHDPMTVVAVSAMLLVVVIVACAIPARRASSVAPAEALRSE
jgi:predicted permease